MTTPNELPALWRDDISAHERADGGMSPGFLAGLKCCADELDRALSSAVPSNVVGYGEVIDGKLMQYSHSPNGAAVTPLCVAASAEPVAFDPSYKMVATLLTWMPGKWENGKPVTEDQARDILVKLYTHAQPAAKVEAPRKVFPPAAFEEWFADIWAGTDGIPVPPYQGDGWDAYIEKRQLALGAWVAATESAPTPASVPDGLLAALERAAAAESALRRLVDECENDHVRGWEDRMNQCIAEANALLASEAPPTNQEGAAP